MSGRTKLGVVVGIGGFLGIAGVFLFFAMAWTAGPDQFLVLTRKYGNAKKPGQILAKDGERGVLEKTLGTGRHFINPIMYEVRRERATVIGPTQIGIVTSKAGKAPASGTWLAERGERGVWRDVLGPGVYKMNPVAYKIEITNVTRIAPGEVGVLINNLTSKVEKLTLPPGLHKINTRLYKVIPVDVGVKHLGYSKKGKNPITEKMLLEDEESREILRSNTTYGGAIGFPSRDGFNVALDASIVYEVKPEHGVALISKFGNTRALTERIIDPALNSVTRNIGSSVTAKQIIQGDTRLEFQDRFTTAFLEELNGEPVNAIDALPRGLYVPLKIQLPIMKATLKQELKLTNKEIELTAELQNNQERARKEVQFEIEKVRSESEYEVSNIRTEMAKEVATYRAETEQKVAEVRLKMARIESETRLIKSQGEADVLLYAGQKKAELKTYEATALGGKKNLVFLQFVDALPERIPFRVLHSGEGTLWTDLGKLDPEQKAVMGQLQRIAGAKKKRSQ